jgi:hypothetical protein
MFESNAGSKEMSFFINYPGEQKIANKNAFLWQQCTIFFSYILIVGDENYSGMTRIAIQRWALKGPCPCNVPNRNISARAQALGRTLSPAYTLNRTPCRRHASLVITNSYSSGKAFMLSTI